MIVRKINKEAIVQFVILALTAFFLVNALLRGEVNKYVHPRFYFGLWVSGIVMVLFAASALLDGKKGRHNVNLSQYLIFFIPLIFACLFPARAAGNTDMVLAENATQSPNSSNKPKGYHTKKKNTNNNNKNNQRKNQKKQSDIDVSKNYNKYQKGGIYIINDDVFANWYTDVYDNLGDFVGKKVQYLAQVYHMKGLKKNQFLAGRYFMVCCAADLVGYGVLCKSDKGSALKENQWITVVGTIKKDTYHNTVIPILTNVTIKKTKPPKVAYIYYNNSN
jgi:putative membrane protein